MIKRFFALLLLLVLVGCNGNGNGTDNEILNETNQKINDSEKIKEFLLTPFSYKIVKDQYYDDILYEAKVNKDFTELTHNEKLDLLKEWTAILEVILKPSEHLISCGKEKECSLDEIKIIDGEDAYTLPLTYGENEVKLNDSTMEYEKTNEELIKEEKEKAIFLTLNEMLSTLNDLEERGAVQFYVEILHKKSPDEIHSYEEVLNLMVEFKNAIIEYGYNDLLSEVKLLEKLINSYSAEIATNKIMRDEWNRNMLSQFQKIGNYLQREYNNKIYWEFYNKNLNVFK